MVKTIIKVINLLIFLIFVSSVQALTFESYINSVELTEKNSFHTIEAIFSNAIGQVDFILIPRINNLHVYIDDYQKECLLNEKVGFSILRCSVDDKEKHFVKITFDTNYPLLNIEDKIMFKSSYNLGIKTKQFIYLLKLPEGFAIAKENGKDVSFFINPKPNLIYSDGRKIILRWDEKNLIDTFEISVFMENVVGTSGRMMIPIIALLLLLVVLIAYILNNKKKRTMHLLAKEEKIVTALKKAKNQELWQKQLQIETSFSKAKLSRTVRDLEARGIIKKEPWGNTNKISLISDKHSITEKKEEKKDLNQKEEKYYPKME